MGLFRAGYLEGHRKLTFDYGMRYDLQKPERELWRRTSTFRADVVNPNANGRLGGVFYEGRARPLQLHAGHDVSLCVRAAPRSRLSDHAEDRFASRLGLAYVLHRQHFNYIGAGNSQGMGFNTVNFSRAAIGRAARQAVRRPDLRPCRSLRRQL